MCCGCDTSYIVTVHIPCQASIYTLSSCRGHSWRVRLAKQETLPPPGHLVSPLVCRGPWMSTVVLYCWCHSDSTSVLLYFTTKKIHFKESDAFQNNSFYLIFLLMDMRNEFQDTSFYKIQFINIRTCMISTPMQHEKPCDHWVIVSNCRWDPFVGRYICFSSVETWTSSAITSPWLRTSVKSFFVTKVSSWQVW